MSEDSLPTSSALQSGGGGAGIGLAITRILAALANGGFMFDRYDMDGMTRYVNNGTALWAGFALRLGRRSELM